MTLSALALVTAGCGSTAPAGPGPTSSSASPGQASPVATNPATASGSPVRVARPPAVRTVATIAGGLEVPWGLAFLPDGSALVAQRRSGEVVQVRPDGSTRSVGRVPGVADRGEGGLLGLAIEPDDPSRVMAYLTTDDDNRVVSMPFDGERLGDPKVLLDGIPAGSIHNGGRLAIGPDGYLYIGTGDAGERNRAQSSSDLGGKILRIATDGSIPADNPDPATPVWSRGHRNVQGLAFDSAGRLWATEFGQNRLDELNRIVRGGNYGWPLVEGRGGGDRFVDPQAVWPTDQASPSGLAILDDVAVLAGLRGQRLWLVPLVDGRAGEPVDALTGEYGRLRTVAAGRRRHPLGHHVEPRRSWRADGIGRPHPGGPSGLTRSDAQRESAGSRALAEVVVLVRLGDLRAQLQDGLGVHLAVRDSVTPSTWPISVRVSPS